MVRRWSSFKDPWDREYAMRGRLWRGSADAAPLVQALDGETVVEIACGDGKFLGALAASGVVALGLDRSVHALRRAREAGATRLVRGDMTHLPLKDGSAPAIALRYALGALMAASRATAASEAWRALSMGGIALVEEFSQEDFRHGGGNEVEEGTVERNRGIATHYWTREEFASTFPVLPLRLDSLEWTQRTREGAKPRRAWRGLWRKPA